MPRTASKNAKPQSIARRDRRRRARTGRPAKRPDTRALLAQSLVRESNWLILVEQMESRIGELESLADAQASSIVRQRGLINLLTAQGYHVKGLYAALLQRYVGAKLDTQHFTLPQAQAFVDRETAALEASLEALKRNQERATGDCDAQVSGTGWTAEYVATPVEDL